MNASRVDRHSVPSAESFVYAGCVFALLCIAYVLIFDGGPPASTAAKGEVIATVEDAQNDVRMRPAAMPAWEVLSTGRELRQRDHVFTSEGASTNILFKDGSKLTVNESTLVVMELESQSPALDIRRGIVYIVSGKSETDVVFTVNGVRGNVKAGHSEAVINVGRDGSADVVVVKGVATIGKMDIISRHASRVAKDGTFSAPAPMALILDQPAWDADVFLSTNKDVNFAWIVQAPLKDLQMQLASDAQFSAVARTLAVRGSQATVGNLPVGRMFWRISGLRTNTDGTEERVNSDARRINFIAIVPPRARAPKADATLEHDTGPSKVFFDWTTPDGGSAVDLEIATSAATDKAIHQIHLARPPYLHEGLTDGRYVYRLRATYTNGAVSSWSENVPFDIVSHTTTAPLIAVSPLDGASIASSRTSPRPIPFWFSGGGHVKNLQLDLSATESFDELTAQTTAPGLKALWQPKAAGTYWWRARVQDVLGRTSDFTAPRQIKVVMTDIELLRPKDAALLPSLASAEDRTFVWSSVEGAKHYRVELTPDPVGSGPVIRLDSTEPKVLWANPPPGRYRWRVTAEPESGAPPLSSDSRSITVPKAPLAPPTLEPKDILIEWGEKAGWRWRDVLFPRAYAAPVIGGRARITWSASYGATGYRLQISGTANFAKVVLDERTEKNTFDWRDPEPGRYFYRVAAVSADGTATEFSAPAELKVSFPQPLLLAPVEGATIQGDDSASVEFRWQDATATPGYLVEVSNRADFAVLAAADRTASGSLSIKLKGGAKYFWRIVAIAGNGSRLATSAVRRLTVKASAPLSAPLLLTPPDGAHVTGSEVAVAWHGIAGLTPSYTVQVSRAANFSKVDNQKNTATTHTSIPLKPGRYYLRVQGTDAQRRKSSWSPVRTFVLVAPAFRGPPPPPERRLSYVALGPAGAFVKYTFRSDAVERNISSFAKQAALFLANSWFWQLINVDLRAQGHTYSVEGKFVTTGSEALSLGIRLPPYGKDFFVVPYVAYARSELLVFSKNASGTKTVYNWQPFGAGSAGLRLLAKGERYSGHFAVDYGQVLPMTGREADTAVVGSSSFMLWHHLSERWLLGGTIIGEYRSLHGLRKMTAGAEKAELTELTQYFGLMLGFLL
jgi:hypothetical protein